MMGRCYLMRYLLAFEASSLLSIVEKYHQPEEQINEPSQGWRIISEQYFAALSCA